MSLTTWLSWMPRSMLVAKSNWVCPIWLNESHNLDINVFFNETKHELECFQNFQIFNRSRNEIIKYVEPQKSYHCQKSSQFWPYHSIQFFHFVFESPNIDHFQSFVLWCLLWILYIESIVFIQEIFSYTITKKYHYIEVKCNFMPSRRKVPTKSM